MGEESREMVETMKALRKVQGEAGGDCGGIKYSMGEGVKGYVKGGKAYVWWPTIATTQPRQQPELLQAYKRNEKSDLTFRMPRLEQTKEDVEKMNPVATFCNSKQLILCFTV